MIEKRIGIIFLIREDRVILSLPQQNLWYESIFLDQAQ